MKRFVIILFATIVTTPLLEARPRPKIVVYEVSEQERDNPELELSKIEDLEIPLNDKYGEQTLQQDGNQLLNEILKDKQKNGNGVKHNSSKRNKNSHQYGSNKYKNSKNHKSNHIHNDKDRQSYKERDSNYRNNKQRNNHDDKINAYLESLLIDWNGQNSNKKNRNRNIQLSNIDSPYSNRDTQGSNRNKQYNNKNNQDYQYINLDDQLSNYIKRQVNREGKPQDKRQEEKSRNYYQFDVAEDYADFLNRDHETVEPQTEILSQLLSPYKRQKRETERSRIIQRLKTLLKRLQQIDSDGKARLNGKVYISNVDDLDHLRGDYSS